ncbi:DEAD/DEAH box helicase domain-containing protein [Deinobacterium chartae]|uniref:DEAD/DEAH box helicase domain-containing protein n=1 Tax=Deinobacterium chartae TaxID=521158 RepID=A0A841I8G4_9DEIO|nr:DEAD/DEAH box helicase domain-containing protein [Deinobacterium chartae]
MLGPRAPLLFRSEAQPGRSTPVSELGWSERVRRGFGFDTVYHHQAEAYAHLEAGRHVVLTTPTASGKTGAFFPAVFAALERDPDATALFVYPLVALAQDQGEKLAAFLQRGGFDWASASFQGNARAEATFRDEVRMVTATPDKLHWSLTHPATLRFLRGLRFLVLDEAHTYRGGFGSEVSGMLRRLLTLARSLGARPQLILSTATIGNPVAFARELCGIEAVEVSRSGAPQYGKDYYLADHRGQPRRFWDAVVSASARYDLKTLAFFRGRGRALRLYGNYRARPEYADRVHLYMAGAGGRDARLSDFRGARGGVMFATNALEAGVDIGDLEVVILDGYPGSRMAFRQMAGRAGRASPGLVLYLPALDERGVPQPVDAFYSNVDNFRELLVGPVERAVVEPANPYLAPRHAARLLEEHRAAGVTSPPLEGLFPGPPPAGRPAYWNLRGAGQRSFFVVESADWETHGERALARALETPGEHYAYLEKHVDAVFDLEGQGYRVERWQETAQGTVILVRPYTAGDLFTRGLFEVRLRPAGPGSLGEWQRAGQVAYRCGEVTVQRRYGGYQLMRQVFARRCLKCDREPELHESRCLRCGGVIGDRMTNLKMGDVAFEQAAELPAFRTVALEVAVNASLEVAHTLKHLLSKLIPERVACDTNDLGGAFRSGLETHFFLYDDWPGGLGVARRVFEVMPELLGRALALAASRCCEHGCYQCTEVGRCAAPFLPSGERRGLDKAATRALLEASLGRPAPPPGRHVRSSPPAAAEPVPSELDWRLQARELLELRGLSLLEVSRRLGRPGREIEAALRGLPPLEVFHPRFGVGVLLAARGSGARREVSVRFADAQRQLLVEKAGLTVAQAASPSATAEPRSTGV